MAKMMMVVPEWTDFSDAFVDTGPFLMWFSWSEGSDSGWSRLCILPTSSVRFRWSPTQGTCLRLSPLPLVFSSPGLTSLAISAVPHVPRSFLPRSFLMDSIPSKMWASHEGEILSWSLWNAASGMAIFFSRCSRAVQLPTVAPPFDDFLVNHSPQFSDL